MTIRDRLARVFSFGACPAGNMFRELPDEEAAARSTRMAARHPVL